ncbi:hypothetical protein U1Q18_043419 [Sarracenia purpurea var. burkii]
MKAPIKNEEGRNKGFDDEIAIPQSENSDVVGRIDRATEASVEDEEARDEDLTMKWSRPKVRRVALQAKSTRLWKPQNKNGGNVGQINKAIEAPFEDEARDVGFDDETITAQSENSGVLNKIDKAMEASKQEHQQCE